MRAMNCSKANENNGKRPKIKGFSVASESKKEAGVLSGPFITQYPLLYWSARRFFHQSALCCLCCPGKWAYTNSCTLILRFVLLKATLCCQAFSRKSLVKSRWKLFCAVLYSGPAVSARWYGRSEFLQCGLSISLVRCLLLLSSALKTCQQLPYSWFTSF